MLLMALTCKIEEHTFLLMLYNEEVGDCSYITQSSQKGTNTNVTQLKGEDVLESGLISS